MPPFDPRGFGNALRRFGRIQNTINLAKTALLLILLPRFVLKLHNSPLAMYGGMLATAGAAIYLILDWRNQVLISRLDFSEPSIEFVRGALARLRNHKNPFRHGFWLPSVLAVIGVELMYLGLFLRHHLPAAGWALVVVFFVAFPLAVYRLGLKVRAKRFRYEGGEIEEQLSRLQRELEDRSE